MNQQDSIVGQKTVLFGKCRHERDAGRIDIALSHEDEASRFETLPNEVNLQHHSPADLGIATGRANLHRDDLFVRIYFGELVEHRAKHVRRDFAEEADARVENAFARQVLARSATAIAFVTHCSRPSQRSGRFPKKAAASSGLF